MSNNEAELDLAIENMGYESTEEKVKEVLEKADGVISAHLHEMGALIRYNSATTSKEAICELLEKAGFQATVFQDSASGETNEVNY